MKLYTKKFWDKNRLEKELVGVQILVYKDNIGDNIENLKDL
jgi:hypothetical protein